MKTKDSLDRRFPNNDQATPDEGVQLDVKRDCFLFEKLDWHGILPTDHLFHHFKEIRGNPKASKTMFRQRLRRLATVTDTKHGRYLYRPKEQFPALRGGRVPRNHHVVYSLDEGGVSYLKDNNRYAGYKHGSGFEHKLMQSCFSSEIEIGTYSNRDYTFIPRHRVTTKANEYKVFIPELGHDIEFHDDGLFGIDYGGVARNHFIEVDRSTEVLHDLKSRKTIHRMLLQWHYFLIREGSAPSEYAKQLNVNKPAVVLFVFLNAARMATAMEICQKELGGSKYIWFATDDRFEGKTTPAPMVSLQNYTGAYKVVGRPDKFINLPQ